MTRDLHRSLRSPRFLLPGLLALAAPAVAATQSPAYVPPGFALPTVVSEAARATAVRTVGFVPGGFLVAVDRELELRATGAAPRPLLRLRQGEDFGFVTSATSLAASQALIGELHGGDVRVLDLGSGQVTSSFAGIANSFDAVALPGGDALVTANPLWPAPGASSGVWHIGPGRAPRELLSLSGPSSAIALAANGDLVVGELGPIVPPPTGSARVLRFPAALVAQALAGSTLSVAQASAVGSGFSGIYDLAFDDRGRLHVTDPVSGTVRHCPAGSLSPTGLTLDLGPGRYALQLAFAAHPVAPFMGYQPPDRAPALLVTHTDFVQTFAISRLQPERPRLAVAPAGPLPPGPATLDLTGAPANGLAAFVLAAAGPVPEQIFARVGGTPLWLGIPANAPVAVWLAPTSAQGVASSVLFNPGGSPVTFTLQVVALGPPGAAAVGSTLPHLLTLQP